MSQNNKNNGGGEGCLVLAILAVFAMPLVGMYLVFTGECKGQRYLGVALTIVSIIVYAKYGMI